MIIDIPRIKGSTDSYCVETMFWFLLLLFFPPPPDMDWLWNQDASHDLLLAVHPPNYIVLWNGDAGTKLWKKSYAENILSFSFDPFDPSNLACTYKILSTNLRKM